jgi:hypothetical protein
VKGLKKQHVYDAQGNLGDEFSGSVLGRQAEAFQLGRNYRPKNRRFSDLVSQ